MVREGIREITLANMANQATAMILTYNEEPNIARTLEAVAWVKEILIVDSGSSDATLARSLPAIRRRGW